MQATSSVVRLTSAMSLAGWFVFFLGLPIIVQAAEPSREQAEGLLRQARLRDEMRTLRFPALLEAEHGEIGARWWAEFTPSGPIYGAARSVSPGLRQATFDAKTRTVYGIRNSLLGIAALASANCDPVRSENDPPMVNDASPLAFDARRRRVLIAQAESWQVYDVELRRWSKLPSQLSASPLALGYAADEDVIYGLELGDQEVISALLALSPDGTLLRRTAIDKLIRCRGAGTRSLQIIPREDQIVVLVGTQSSRGDFGSNAHEPGFGYVIDPRSGQVLFGERLQLQPAQTRSSLAAATGADGSSGPFPEERAALEWDALTRAADANSMDDLLWRMAARGDDTVAYVRKHLPAGSLPVVKIDPQQVERWIVQLDDDSFELRDQASAALARLGVTVLPALNAAASSPSAETRARVKKLLAALRDRRSPEAMLEERALELLVRIRSEQAVRYLLELAGDASSRYAQPAQAALARIASLESSVP